MLKNTYNLLIVEIKIFYFTPFKNNTGVLNNNNKKPKILNNFCFKIKLKIKMKYNIQKIL